MNGCINKICVDDKLMVIVTSKKKRKKYRVRNYAPYIYDQVCKDLMSRARPWWSIPHPGHKCVWSERELNEVGFNTIAYSFMPDLLMYILYGGIILGVKERYV